MPFPCREKERGGGMKGSGLHTQVEVAVGKGRGDIRGRGGQEGIYI